MATVTFTSVGKVYGDGTRAVQDLTFQVDDGEFVVLVGPSGCGKTTALRMVAGLEEISEGVIRIGDRVVNHLEPQKRDVAMVFQNYALYPHMTVFDNIGFGLKMKKTPKPEIGRRVQEISRILGLEDSLRRRPRQLSGGQRQRVAMGRAIVRNPSVFLMDEPLSNLDARLRVQMRAEIARIQRQLGATTIYVTHDQIEAMTMGDRVAVMRKGELQQVDIPQALYDRPVNLFVASFIGSPPMNLVQGRLEEGAGKMLIKIGDQALPLPRGVAAKRSAMDRYLGKRIGIGIRPEHLRQASDTDDGSSRLRGKVFVAEALGSEQLVHLEIEAEPIVTSEVVEVATDVDAAALDELKSEAQAHRSMLLARVETGVRAQPGERFEVAIDAAKLHFFDLETGSAIA